MSGRGIVHLDPVAFARVVKPLDDEAIRVLIAACSTTTGLDLDPDPVHIAKTAGLGVRITRAALVRLAGQVLVETDDAKKHLHRRFAPGFEDVLVFHPSTGRAATGAASGDSVDPPIPLAATLPDVRDHAAASLREHAGPIVADLATTYLARVESLGETPLRIETQIRYLLRFISLTNLYGVDTVCEAFDIAIEKITSPAAADRYLTAVARRIANAVAAPRAVELREMVHRARENDAATVARDDDEF